MAALRVLLCILALTAAALAQASDVSVPLAVSVSAGHGQASIMTIARLSGNTSIAPVGGLTENTTLCFSTFPIYTTDLATACPVGGLIYLSNTTVPTEVRFAQKSFSAFSSTKRLSNRFASSVLDGSSGANYNANIVLLSSTLYYVTVFAANQANTTVSLNITYLQCPDNQVGNPCVTPEVLTNGAAVVTVGAATTGFVFVDPTQYNTTIGSVTFTVSATVPPPAASLVAAAAADPFTLTAQVGALPGPGSFAQVIGSGSTITIENPGSLTQPLYLGVATSNQDAISATVTSTVKVCGPNTFGNQCTAIANLTAAFGSSNVGTTGNAKSGDLVVFQIPASTIPPSAGNPPSVQIIRASVSSKTSNTANAIYASFGVAPSVTSFQYYLNSTTYVNQLLLPNLQSAASVPPFVAAWYVAVVATNDYTVWAGNNCPGSCAISNDNGKCTCNNQVCNGTNVYQLPLPSAIDSKGDCQCNDVKKQNNYDCSALIQPASSPFKTVYIVLIAVGGAIVLAVAIGVPVYCYLQNRKRDYERL